MKGSFVPGIFRCHLVSRVEDRFYERGSPLFLEARGVRGLFWSEVNGDGAVSFRPHQLEGVD